MNIEGHDLCEMIELEMNGTDGSVGLIHDSSLEKIADSFKEFPGCYYLLWIKGSRTDTPLRSTRAIGEAIIHAIFEESATPPWRR